MRRQSEKAPAVPRDHKGHNKPEGNPPAEEAGQTTALGARIEGAMRDRGLSKAELARRVGVKRWATIHDWITGRQEPRARNLIRLAEALQMDPMVLLDEMLPEPKAQGWRDFKAKHEAKITLDDLIDVRIIARRRPYVTLEQLEAVLSMLRVGAPAG